MWLGTHFNLSWAGNVFQHLLRLPQDYFLKRHLGDIVSRFGAVGVMQQTLTTQFVGVILDGALAVLTLAVMVIYSPLLAGVVTLALAIYAAMRVLYYRVYFESNLSMITTSAKQQSVFMEATRGVQTIRLHNQTAAHTSRYLNATANALNTSIKVQQLKLLFGSINGLTTGATRVVVLWIGAWLALGGHFSAGMLMAYVAYTNQFTSSASGLIDYVVQLKLLRLQGERLADIVLTKPEANTEAQWGGPEPEASIRFDKVSFRYAAGEPWVLEDCSFEVKAGEAVAITGPSGSGKSTLVRLLLGLLDPQQGDIRIGGVNLQQLGKHAWRNMVRAVMQDDILFAGSIADNISFHDEASTPKKIEWAAKQAQIHDDIMHMPMGYQTLVGDMGSALSGGQRQRLFLARALYSHPKVLVMDEATSHIDVAREHKINDALKTMNNTRILVAHRLDTIRNADRVLLCQQGIIRPVKLTEPTPPSQHTGPFNGEIPQPTSASCPVT
jgi:ATP-binding cassette subfamily B protein RaxB